MGLFALAKRLPFHWFAFIDNTAGEAAPRKGYGKDAFVSDLLGHSGTTRLEAAVCQGRVQGQRSRRRVQGGRLPRTAGKLDTPAPLHHSIIEVLIGAAADADYAANQAVDDLEHLLH